MNLNMRQRHEKHPKFYNKRGWLTPYGLACGYQEVAIEAYPKTVETSEVDVKLWHEGGTVYHVRGHDFAAHERLFWETFELLEDARKCFSIKRRQLGLTRV